MNRRNFFKVVTGFVAGVVAVAMPKAIGSKHSGTRYCGETSTSVESNWIDVKDFDKLAERKKLMSFHPAYIIHEDGSIEPIPYQDFYKTNY